MADASTGNIVEYNEIFNHEQEDGIDIKNSYPRTTSVRDPYNIIRNNVIYGNAQQTGITVQMESRNVKIHNNEIYMNKWGIWLNDANTEGVEIYNNSIYKNEFTGIIINQDTKGNVKITGNTIYDNGSTTSPGVKAGISINAGSNYELSNNILGNNGLRDSSFQAQVIVDAGQTPSTIIDSDKYFCTWSNRVIRWGGVDMTVEQFRQATGKGANCQYVDRAYNPVPTPMNLSIQ
jgi:parallel beta-helix repeat protein